MSELKSSIIAFAVVSIVAILSIMICCLAALGFNSKVRLEKQKIEVNTESNSNLKN